MGVCLCVSAISESKEPYALKEAGRGLNLGRLRLLYEDFGAQIEALGIEGLDSDVRGVSGGKELFQSRK